MDSTCAASVSSSHMEFVSDGNPGNSERCEPRNNSLIGNYCQNAHFQTSESRLDVHTHFWFFHFCRLNRELFLGHVISTRRRREPHGTVETRVRAREEQGRLRRPVASLLCEVGRPPAAARDPDTSEVASITLGIVRGKPKIRHRFDKPLSLSPHRRERSRRSGR